MQQIFLDEIPADGKITITGDDFNHLARAVRIKKGEAIRTSADGKSFLCVVDDISAKEIKAHTLEESPSTELGNKIYLFQAQPKGDRMETIIEKTVELGVYEIIPVMMENCIVKLDDKKKASRISRYQAVACSAARQSKRSIIPKVHGFMGFNEACNYAKGLDMVIVPYENEKGMESARECLSKLKPNISIGVFIGPEGGFAESEIEALLEFAQTISLGRRILRTDTAAIAALSILMLKCEDDFENL